MPRSMVMDGEIVCLDKDGRCQFNDLLFRRGETRFVAFDLLQVNEKDLRAERLIDRKHELRRVTPGVSSIIYAEHIERSGIALFHKACELDLEGIVAKDGRAPYDPQRTTWFKIRNSEYSQMVGREELFEQDRHREPVAGWHSCSLACGEPEL
jgi:bifunctional non-homologous end joining protein LigD